MMINVPDKACGGQARAFTNTFGDSGTNNGFSMWWLEGVFARRAYPATTQK